MKTKKTGEIAKVIRRHMKRMSNVLEKLLCYNLVLLITPFYFIFEVSVVRPALVARYGIGSIEHTLHIVGSSFCFVNVVGNMMFSIFTDTRAKVSTKSENYCERCQTRRPAAAWHCNACDACILRRDHHCFFFSRCIGLRNRRYYVLYLGYVFISMVYSLYYNYYYVVTKFEDDSMVLSAFRVINPFLRYLIPEPMGMRDLYVLFLFLNTGLLFWSAGLFYFHMMNVLRDLTAHESSRNGSGAWDWEMVKMNFVNVFGVKWYWAIFFPFARSPLPGDVELKYE